MYATGDVDNYTKSILDGLNGIAYQDDKQVHHLEVVLTKADYDTYMEFGQTE